MSIGRVGNHGLREATYEALRRALLLPGWSGGQQLNLQDLSRALGVSETPVKEAVRTLADHGLLEIRPRQGTFVRPITRSRLDQAVEVRILLESWALREIGGRARLEDWSRTEELVQAMLNLSGEGRTGDDLLRRFAEFAVLDAQFHTSFLRACHNDPLVQIYESLGTHYLFARASVLHDARHLDSNIKRSNEAHSAILNAARRAAPDLACRLLIQHVDVSYKRALRVVEGHGGEI